MRPLKKAIIAPGLVVVLLVVAVGVVSGLLRAPAMRDVEAQCGMARLYCQQGLYDNALALYQSLMKRTHGAPFVRLGLAAAYFEKGDYAAAEEHYRRLLDSGDNSPIVLFDLGQTLARQKRPTEAAVYFRKFVQLYGKSLPDLSREAERVIKVGGE